MKDVRLPKWEGSPVPVWPPYRPLDPALITPVPPGDPRLYTSRWYEVWRNAHRHALTLLPRGSDLDAWPVREGERKARARGVSRAIATDHLR